MLDDNSRPFTYNGQRLTGITFLTTITDSLKERIRDCGGPDFGPTAPFLFPQDWEESYWSPEKIERVCVMYKLQISFTVQ